MQICSTVNDLLGNNEHHSNFKFAHVYDFVCEIISLPRNSQDATYWDQLPPTNKLLFFNVSRWNLSSAPLAISP